MKRIGLISDTHCFVDNKLYKYFEDCDEIWHAGDIGNIDTADELSTFKPLRAVHGNIDGHDVRIVYPQHQRFKCEDVDVWITHIGGYPDHYAPEVRKEIIANPPKLFIAGHSHILKVIYDKKLNLLHINPGAAGNSGFHKIKTAIRFTIDGKDIKDLEVIELEKRS
jgi:putative phosphoesterase